MILEDTSRFESRETRTRDEGHDKDFILFVRYVCIFKTSMTAMYRSYLDREEIAIR